MTGREHSFRYSVIECKWCWISGDLCVNSAYSAVCSWTGACWVTWPSQSHARSRRWWSWCVLGSRRVCVLHWATGKSLLACSHALHSCSDGLLRVACNQVFCHAIWWGCADECWEIGHVVLHHKINRDSNLGAEGKRVKDVLCVNIQAEQTQWP